MSDKLTAKQKLFCENYVSNGYKLVQAYMDAFGVSYEVANANQWRLMKQDAIKRYIRDLQHDRFEAMGVTADRIAAELTKIATDPDATNSERMRAWELIQKQLGLQTQRVEADIKTTTITVGLDDDE